MAMTIDTTNLCSHLQKKLFEPEGIYYPIWQAMQNDEELTAVVRSRQLHIYRNGKKILILAGKAQPKIIREDKLIEDTRVDALVLTSTAQQAYQIATKYVSGYQLTTRRDFVFMKPGEMPRLIIPTA